jgi:hypothetical protein
MIPELLFCKNYNPKLLPTIAERQDMLTLEKCNESNGTSK